MWLENAVELAFFIACKPTQPHVRKKPSMNSKQLVILVSWPTKNKQNKMQTNLFGACVFA